MAAYKLKAVDPATLTSLISQPQTRAGSSKGAELIDEFLSSGNVAASVAFPSTKDRNSVSISASNYCRNNGVKVWVRKLGGGQGAELLLVNLDKADGTTKKAFDNRPRPGRRPAAKK
jgi:hypothetical protein